MSNDLQVFSNQEFGQIRMIELNGEPWFVGKDIAELLGYSNARDALYKHVDSDDKCASQFATPSGTQKMTIINESGLYSLILSSKLPTAKQFKKWITSEVIPSIRKHGAYLTDTKIEEILSDPDTIIRLATDLKHERETRKQLEAQNLQLEEDNKIMKPKADFYDEFIDSSGFINASKIAMAYNMTAVEFNKMLAYLKIQYKNGKTWVLRKEYLDKEYTAIRPYYIKHKDGSLETKMYMVWTPPGYSFLYDRLITQHGKEEYYKYKAEQERLNKGNTGDLW